MSIIIRNRDPLLNAEESANYLNVKPQTLAVWRMKGLHLPVVKIGKSVRYRQSDLDAFISKQTIPASS